MTSVRTVFRRFRMDGNFLYTENAEDADKDGENVIEKVPSVYFRQIRVPPALRAGASVRVQVFTAHPGKSRLFYRGVSS